MGHRANVRGLPPPMANTRDVDTSLASAPRGECTMRRKMGGNKMHIQAKKPLGGPKRKRQSISVWTWQPEDFEEAEAIIGKILS